MPSVGCSVPSGAELTGRKVLPEGVVDVLEEVADFFSDAFESLVEVSVKNILEDLPGTLDAESLVYGTARLFGDSVDSPVEVAVGNLVEDLPGTLDAESIVYGIARPLGSSVDSLVEVTV